MVNLSQTPEHGEYLRCTPTVVHPRDTHPGIYTVDGPYPGIYTVDGPYPGYTHRGAHTWAIPTVVHIPGHIPPDDGHNLGIYHPMMGITWAIPTVV